MRNWDDKEDNKRNDNSGGNDGGNSGYNGGGNSGGNRDGNRSGNRYEVYKSWAVVIFSILVCFYFFCAASYFIGKHVGRNEGRKEITETSCYRYIVEHESKLHERYHFVPKK